MTLFPSGGLCSPCCQVNKLVPDFTQELNNCTISEECNSLFHLQEVASLLRFQQHTFLAASLKVSREFHNQLVEISLSAVN